MPICMLKRGDLCGENEARFLYQNEVNLRDRGKKMAANLDLFRMHLHWQPNASTKLELRSLIVKLDYFYQSVGYSTNQACMTLSINN